jgi:DNA-binding IscR family transcriptional regulator
MQQQTIDKLKEIAPILLAGKIPNPAPIHAQRAIAILAILQDGKWHTSEEIAEEVGISKSHTKQILYACRDAWNLASSNDGWMLAKKNSIIIV